MKNRFSAIEQALGNSRGGAGQARETGRGRDPYLDAAGAESQANPSPTQGERGAAEMPGAQRDGMFSDIRDEIVRLIREGRLPEDFDLQQACMDPAFAGLLAELPPEAAIRVYAAEKRADEAEQSAMQRMSAQVRSRGALPKSSRGGAMGAPAVNYRDMDSATFRKMLGEIKKTTRNGGKVRL